MVWQKIPALVAFSVGLGIYSQKVVRPQPTGWPRLLRVLPFLISCLTVPSLLDAIIPSVALIMTPIAGIYSLDAFKLLAFCFDRGALTLPLTPTQFAAYTVIPVIPAEAYYTSGGSPASPTALRGPLELLFDFLPHFSACIGVSSIILAYPGLYWAVRQWLLVLAFELYLQALGDVICAVFTFFCPLPPAPLFNKPWLSESVEDFWARRWNLITSYILRTLIYEPIMQGRLLQAPSAMDHALDTSISSTMPEALGTGMSEGLKQRHVRTSKGEELVECREFQRRTTRAPAWRRFLAVEATFVFSGVWHILIFYYNTRVWSLHWPLFFFIQGPIIILERKLSRKMRLPRILRIVLTNLALILIGGPTFVAPAEETGFAGRHLLAAQGLLRRLAAWVPQGMQPSILTRAVQRQDILPLSVFA